MEVVRLSVASLASPFGVAREKLDFRRPMKLDFPPDAPLPAPAAFSLLELRREHVKVPHLSEIRPEITKHVELVHLVDIKNSSLIFAMQVSAEDDRLNTRRQQQLHESTGLTRSLIAQMLITSMRRVEQPSSQSFDLQLHCQAFALLDYLRRRCWYSSHHRRTQRGSTLHHH